jgi:hypothetical protein
MRFRNIFFIIIIYFLSFEDAFSQNESYEKLGFKKLEYKFEEENVSILIKSKKGEEHLKKPLIIYIQGSMARPLIINYPKDKNYKYSLAFPFSTDKLSENFHIAVISKPFIPCEVNIEDLDNSYSYIDPITHKNPLNFLKNDNLNYLTRRDEKIIKMLRKEDFVMPDQMILIGHSEGSRVAFEITKNKNNISKLIYLSGNPFGRYMNLVSSDRKQEKEVDLLKNDSVFYNWKKTVQNKEINNYQEGGDTFKSTYLYSQPYFEDFLKMKIPVFIGYGSKDDGAIFNDLFQLYAINQNKSNFYFKTYIGLEHSFYPVKDDGEVNHENPKIDNVFDDIILWLKR